MDCSYIREGDQVQHQTTVGVLHRLNWYRHAPAILSRKRARTANKDDSRSITKVTDELIVRSCDPPHQRAYGLEIL
jgi:hypothetical protein